MTPKTSEWLARKVPEFSELQSDEKNAIFDFSLLWSLFEGLKLNCNCNVNEIRNLVTQIEQHGGRDDDNLACYVSYLRNRYYVNCEFTHHYANLHLERSGNPVEVEEMLRNEGCSIGVKLIGCLVVVFRLRNNLFHGEKWQYKMKGQLDNFQHANEFLRNLMDDI